MKRRIIFGVVLSAFVLLSLTWLTPVQVKASEEDGSKIVEAINRYYNHQSEQPDDLNQLIDMHNNEDIQDIFNQVLLAQSESELNQLAQDYKDIIDFGQVLDIGQRLNLEFGEEFNSIENQILSLLNNKEQRDTEEYYYKISLDENGIKVTKSENEQNSEDSIIIRGSDGAIKLSDSEWSSPDWLENLKDFLNMCGGAGFFVSYAGIIIGQLGLILALLGLEKIGHFIFTLGMRVGFIGLMMSMGSVVILMFIDIIEKLFEKSRETYNKSATKLIDLLNSKLIKLPLVQKLILRILALSG
jgi:hypothetical protein